MCTCRIDIARGREIGFGDDFFDDSASRIRNMSVDSDVLTFFCDNVKFRVFF